MNRKVILSMLLINLLISTSCMKTTKEKSAQLAQSERAPESLVSVMRGIDEILDSISSMERNTGLSLSEFEVLHPDTGSKNDKAKDGGRNRGDQSKDGMESNAGGNEDNKKLTSKDEETLKAWKTIDDRIEKIHKDWNSYEAKGIKKAASIEKSNELKENLNLFTIAIENRDMVSIMDNGSKTLFSLSYYFDLYRDEVLGDLTRISYVAYQAYLKAKGKDINGADKLLRTVDKYIANLRQKIDRKQNKEKLESIDKLSLSLGDMRQSLRDASEKLLEIKRDIILENTKGLQN